MSYQWQGPWQPMRPSDEQPPHSAPVLGRGRHLNPRDGACLMEYVSFLSGGPFTDTPACTDRLVAIVAILANDNVAGPRRRELIRYAPALAAAGPRTDRERVMTLIAVLDVAARYSGSTEITRLRRRAERRLVRLTRRPGRTGWKARLDEAVWLPGTARRSLESAVAALAVLPPDHRDKALIAMLDAALARPSSVRTSGRTPAPRSHAVAG
ncbi:hypothetical protein [Yinghuangia sp. YIM S10712]|uniref:hypothetical protein n=1 Tax=Yinghuangia sp. YIM S10712 TaxID=3436930 RepID=UPI003F5335BB